MLWEEMIASPLSEKLLYTCLVICFSGMASCYYQHMIQFPFNIDISFGAILISGGIFLFLFATFWWSLASAVLSGVLGGILFTRKVT
ncbi:MAG TPA: hypothetical protein K8V79_04775 [Acinetobacter lwoffii]|uniref:Uncharacterized protein n=1 Tax=Acinetobacter lwoffii TaxID=28090 RepID=A0A9D2URV9_ACILW|nr:hypothetical protein [Acinetobacter lwoffii]